MPRARTAALTAAAALLVRRAVRRRVRAAPLWPLPALEEPVSGRGRGAPTAPRRVRVTGRTAVAEGVVRLRLEGTGLPPWEPGAHLDLILPSGLVRQYSLCGDPAERDAYTVAARLVEDGRGGSREVHERLAVGTEVGIRGPRNRFPLVDAPAYVFVAGGIGITPLLPMVRAVRAAGARYHLLYCGRSRATMPYLDELEGAGDVTVVPEDEAGLPDLGLLDGVSPETAVYVCGPEGLMDAVARRLPEGRPVHLERFAPAAATPGGAFEVELRRSATTVTVAPGQSVLAAVRAELPHVPYSCEQGFCGTCRQPVLAGEVDHRDDLLTDAERHGTMLLCVSRCRSERLVLDL
ncbi:PDR/VanB family oxidoreductase [Streptomyces sp. NPDC015131]|uniref:PDR/VanB family oxidoreductase n=1 Tax=Streptomyces sp. NPDC015131 TaxID=3364941 RepID=UPI0036F6B49F